MSRIKQVLSTSNEGSFMVMKFGLSVMSALLTLSFISVLGTV
jgi:hypothetical protein